ncbi:hypothetical protein CgunFtcFv8_002699 [Champsocephalus gunnari]|uniref:Uncharacterized protein n=1 Tax=Champsocephalus gunnari TaxID=52237 RepID=A0AAN8HMX2_CHAGU|nr:hypothetical protein CgunFtcFv8_002699 [Champsocephalus gunnari]
MKCVCMFLSASGDVEVVLQGPRKLGEPTRSASEKAERRTLGLWEPSPRLRSALVFFLKAHGRTWMRAEL